MDNMFAWPIIKGTGMLFGLLAATAMVTNKVLALAISEDTPITFKAACYIGSALLAVAIWINKNLLEAKDAARQSAAASAQAIKNAELANQIAVNAASELHQTICGLKTQLENLPCHQAKFVCPPK